MSYLWNRYTQTLLLFGLTDYMARLGGWPLSRWLARGGWKFARWGGPIVGRWSIGAGIALLGDAGILARAFATTRTAAAIVRVPAPIAAGLVSGAVAGTAIIYVAEEFDIVEEGSTESVIDFYTGQAEGKYWGSYDWKGSRLSQVTSTSPATSERLSPSITSTHTFTDSLGLSCVFVQGLLFPGYAYRVSALRAIPGSALERENHFRAAHIGLRDGSDGGLTDRHSIITVPSSP